ncbi:MAG: hypothetical protein V4754_04370 [Pseudomonadota bacterium]
MNKQKSSGGDSKQSVQESGNKAGVQDVKAGKKGKDSADKVGKGGGAKQKQKH